MKRRKWDSRTKAKIVVGELTLELKKNRRAGDPVKHRRTSARVIELNAPVLQRVRAIKADHPFWGYRRVWAYLRYIDGLDVKQ